jgi:hypothetical protein
MSSKAETSERADRIAAGEEAEFVDAAIAELDAHNFAPRALERLQRFGHAVLSAFQGVGDETIGIPQQLPE